jgi:ubiquinone/menaquinone biosynthesis C-methylase UbiE
MSDMANQEYLLKDQYRDATNFTLRVETLQRMGVMQGSWYRWIFDHIQIPEQSRVLELGCGPGFLWRENLDRVPQTWEVTLSDFSPGMLEAARCNLEKGGEHFAYQVIDAQAIPYEADHFDAVIANAMLYHVPNLAKALSEVRRVLKPGGKFYATTIGDRAIAELGTIMQRVGYGTWLGGPFGFSIENGGQQLERWFTHVTLDHLEKQLLINERESLLGLVRSGMSKQEQQDAAKLHTAQEAVERLLRQDQALTITMDFGIFIARK